MSEPGKYSVTIVAKSGDRTLTQVVYPNQSYLELVTTELAIMNGLVAAGLTKAKIDGEQVPKELLDLYGVK